MQVIIFCWEFPPRRVGRLADHVEKLSQDLVKNKIETYLVTYHEHLTGFREEPEGIRTYRVKSPVRTHIGVLT